jgi:tetratricopeptide (TPR) repeat protein
MTERDWLKVGFSGAGLNDAAGVELDRQLAARPDDLELRIKRIGFLYFKRRPRAHDVLWLATHHPEVDLLAFTVIPRDEEPEVFERIRLAWMEHVQRSPENSIYRKQAARFVWSADPSEAEALYRQGAALDPAEPDWHERLGSLLIGRSKRAADTDTAMGFALEAVKAFEDACRRESGDSRRLYLYISLAKAAVAAGLHDTASAAAEAALRDASQFEHKLMDGDAIHWGHIVLGTVARRRGDVESALRELELAGRARGSPSLDDYGPDFELAQSLLALGYSDAVLDYLTQCKAFWEKGHETLDRWIQQISSGERPELKR